MEPAKSFSQMNMKKILSYASAFIPVFGLLFMNASREWEYSILDSDLLSKAAGFYHGITIGLLLMSIVVSMIL